jgi:hypothetical protein
MLRITGTLRTAICSHNTGTDSQVDATSALTVSSPSDGG